MLAGLKGPGRLTRRAGADAPLSGAGVQRRRLRRHPASDVGFPPPPLRPIIRRAVFVLALGGRFVAHRNLAVLGLGLKAAPCRLGDRRFASGVQGCQSSPGIVASAQCLEQFPDKGLPARLRRLSPIRPFRTIGPGSKSRRGPLVGADLGRSALASFRRMIGARSDAVRSVVSAKAVVLADRGFPDAIPWDSLRESIGGQSGC